MCLPDQPRPVGTVGKDQNQQEGRSETRTNGTVTIQPLLSRAVPKPKRVPTQLRSTRAPQATTGEKGSGPQHAGA